MLTFEKIMYLGVNSILLVNIVLNSFNYLKISIGLLGVAIIFNIVSVVYVLCKATKKKPNFFKYK